MSNYTSCIVNYDFVQYRNILCQLPLPAAYITLCDRIENLRQRSNILFYCTGFFITTQLLDRYNISNITDNELLVLMVIAYKYSYPDNCSISWAQLAVYLNIDYHMLLQLEVNILQQLKWFIISYKEKLTINNCKCIYCLHCG